ncbi:prepilin peptidase [Pseudomonas tritici]|uniref:prepilin peptidase n=1 Tax=Pseudomonas tritici TaxID=2745518 RepID=UPI00387AEF10
MFLTIFHFLSEHPINSICLAVSLGLAGGHLARHLAANLPAWLELSWQNEAQEYLGIVSQEATSTAAQPATLQTAVQRQVRSLERVYRATKAVDKWRFPVWEVAGAVLVTLAGLQSGFNFWGLAVAMALLIGLVAAVIDARTMLLPDVLVLPLIWLGLTATAITSPALIQENVLACAAGYLCLFMLPMGRGDAKLFAAIGAWAGYEGLILGITVGSLAGVVLGLYLLAKRGASLPYAFGPCLYMGMVLSLLFPNSFHMMREFLQAVFIN